MGGGSVYRYHQVQVYHQRGGVREIFEFVHMVVNDRSVPAGGYGLPELGLGRLALLQADEFHVYAGQCFELLQGQVAALVGLDDAVL